jgi:hypothetical protein
VGLYKKNSGRPSITWPEAVDGALCFGWIDGLRKSVNATSYKISFYAPEAAQHLERGKRKASHRALSDGVDAHRWPTSFSEARGKTIRDLFLRAEKSGQTSDRL